MTFFYNDNILQLQAYIFNIPIGQSIINTARNVVTLGEFLWKLNEHNTGWKTWVNHDNMTFTFKDTSYMSQTASV